MKTTIDLPDALVKQVKLRALHDGVKLKDAVADLLRQGLAVGKPDAKRDQAVVSKDSRTGLPIIQCRTTAPAAEELTPERVAEILLAQEAGWHS